MGAVGDSALPPDLLAFLTMQLKGSRPNIGAFGFEFFFDQTVEFRQFVMDETTLI